MLRQPRLGLPSFTAVTPGCQGRASARRRSGATHRTGYSAASSSSFVTNLSDAFSQRRYDDCSSPVRRSHFTAALLLLLQPPRTDSSDLCFNRCDQTVNVIHDHLINTTAHSTSKAPPPPPHFHTHTLTAFGSEKHFMKRFSSRSIMTKGREKKRKSRAVPVFCSQSCVSIHTRTFQTCFRCNRQRI